MPTARVEIDTVVDVRYHFAHEMIGHAARRIEPFYFFRKGSINVFAMGT